MTKIFKILLCFIILSTQTLSAISVVPGAFGYGMATRAAYGSGSNPTIYRIQNLSDSGSHSLREALEASGPRVVIFETSGTIILSSDINIVYPYITVAGQTAPSPGITVRGAANATVSAGGILVHTHDVLLQHLRIRPGDGGPVLFSTSGHEATNIYDQGYYTATGGGTYNIVFDHCSISWGAAKLTTVYAIQNGANISFWKNIFSEALWRGKNVTDDWAAGDRVSSLAMALGDANGVNYNISLYGNLFAHNGDRNPELGSGVNAQIINNVIYDWGKDPNLGVGWGTFLYTPNGTQVWLADIISNVYIAGPGSLPFPQLYAVGVWSGISGSHYYLTDSTVDATANSATLLDDHAASNGQITRQGSPTQSISGYTILSSSVTKSTVLSWSGAYPAARDAVDARVVGDVTNRTGTMLSSQDQVGGWPVLAQNTRALTTPSNPHTVTGSGYTNLEVWLQGYATIVEGTTHVPTPPTNLRVIS